MRGGRGAIQKFGDATHSRGRMNQHAGTTGDESRGIMLFWVPLPLWVVGRRAGLAAWTGCSQP